MKEPPDQTAELSAANLLSFCGMIVLMYCLTMSSCSRSPESMSRKRTPCRLEISLQLVVDDLGLVLPPTPARYFFSASGIPSLSQVSRISVEVLPFVRLLLGRPDVVVDVFEVDPGEIGAPVRHRPRKEVVEALWRNWRIHSGSFLCSAMASTTSCEMPAPT